MDVALCLEVLEHIEDDQRAVREIHRVLRPDGLLIAAVPYTYYWPQYLKLLGHFRHYTRVMWLAQRVTPATSAAAERAAERIGLPLEVSVVGDGGLERQLERLLAAT